VARTIYKKAFFMTRTPNSDHQEAKAETSSTLPPETGFSNVLVVRAPGEVPPEVRAAAARALQGLGGAPEPAGAEPTRSAGRTDEMHWLDELLTPVLKAVNYRRVESLTYLADFSTADVEHTLIFDMSGQSMTWVSGDAALSNGPAAAFAQQCYERYADPVMLSTVRQSGYVDPPWFRPMRFSIGMLFGWGRLCALDARRFSTVDLGETISEAVRTKLIPYVGTINTQAALLEFLERDEEPMRWFRVRALFRAAMISYLAHTLGVPRGRTQTALLERALALKTGLRNTSLSPIAFVGHILDDAEAALRPS
jgi:hypothetical protein